MSITQNGAILRKCLNTFVPQCSFRKKKKKNMPHAKFNFQKSLFLSEFHILRYAQKLEMMST